MRLRSIGDMEIHRRRLEKSIPGLKIKLQEEINKLPDDVITSKQFQKVLSITSDLRRMQGRLSILSIMPKKI